MHIFPEELIEEVRDAIEPVVLLRLIDYRIETIQNVGQTIKSFCPIHREPIFRTLLIEVESYWSSSKDTDKDAQRIINKGEAFFNEGKISLAEFYLSEVKTLKSATKKMIQRSIDLLERIEIRKRGERNLR